MFGGLLSFVIVVAAALGCAGCCAARPAWSLGQTCAALLGSPTCSLKLLARRTARCSHASGQRAQPRSLASVPAALELVLDAAAKICIRCTRRSSGAVLAALTCQDCRSARQAAGCARQGAVAQVLAVLLGRRWARCPRWKALAALTTALCDCVHCARRAARCAAEQSCSLRCGRGARCAAHRCF